MRIRPTMMAAILAAASVTAGSMLAMPMAPRPLEGPPVRGRYKRSKVYPYASKRQSERYARQAARLAAKDAGH